MAVPTSVADLSVTAASNSPAGADSVTSSTGPDDYLRALAAIIRREQAKGANVASASTVDLGAIADGNYIHITGTTTITAFGTVAAGIERTVVFDGALTLTHNGTSLILPGGANITTAAGDCAAFVSEGSGNWRCKAYSYATGISAFIKTLLDDTDAAAALSTLGITDAIAAALAAWTTGDAKITFKATADTGWVLADDKSIGDASSGATGRANADTSALFALLWTNVSNTYAPVSTGRGASAAADFAAHKTLTLPRTLGRALAVAGAGAGLTARALGEYLGEETHTLITAEMPAHVHTQFESSGGAVYTSGGGNLNAQYGGDTGSAGGGEAHNNMQPTSFLNVMIKL